MSEYEYATSGTDEALGQVGALGEIALFGERTGVYPMSSESLRTYRDDYAMQLDIRNKLVAMQDQLYRMEQMLRDIQVELASRRQELPIVRPLRDE